MARIGEDASERLDIVPAQFRVLVTRRPRYACRRCSGAVVQAHAPEHVVPGGLPTEALIAQVIVSKFGDHLPFYRQAEIYARQGLTLDRATLGNWVGRACFHLRPIVAQMREHLKAADRVFMDETRAPVLSPGRRRTKTGYFWSVVADDRGHGGTGPPVVMVHYAPGRGAAHALRFLEGYRGRFVQCDGYNAYGKLTGRRTARGRLEAGALLDPCPAALREAAGDRWLAHRGAGPAPDRRPLCRREGGPGPAARDPVGRAEGAIARYCPFRPWLEAQALAHSPLVEACRGHPLYLGLWPGLIRFLEDGRLELDTNPVENQIRSIALTRKNALFAGHEVGAENWAMLASLIATCKMRDVNPVDYIAQTLRALLDGHPKSRIEALKSWQFQDPSSLAA